MEYTYKDLVERFKKLKKVIIDRSDLYSKWLSRMPLLVFTIPIGLVFSVYFIYEIFGFTIPIKPVGIFIILFCIGSVLWTFSNIFITKRTLNLLKKLDTHLEQIRMIEWNKKENLNIQEYEKLLSHTGNIYTLGRKLAWIARWFFLADKKETLLFIEFLITYTMDQINRTREVIDATVEENLTKLSAAKEVIDSHITLVSELAGSAELQKARLDRQIEQFEELQRVLVKV